MYSHKHIVHLVEDVIENKPCTTLTTIAKSLGVGRHTITKAIEESTGTSFRGFRKSILLRKAKSLLCQGGTHSIKEISYRMGFTSPRSFERAIVKAFHRPPSLLRESLDKRKPDLTRMIHEARLVESHPIAAGTIHMRFQLGLQSSFQFEPGQFIAVPAQVKEHTLMQSYSIASSPARLSLRIFELCINVADNSGVSSWLSKLQVGNRFPFFGPFGLFTLRQPLQRVLVFVATGTRIAPIRSMLEWLVDRRNTGIRQTECWLFFGARNRERMPYKDEFEYMANFDHTFRFIPVLSNPDDRWTGRTGHVQDHLEELLAAKSDIAVYACGRPEMIADVRMRMGHSSTVFVVTTHG